MKSSRPTISLVILVFCLCSQTVFAAGFSQANIVVTALGIVGSHPYRPFITTSPKALNLLDISGFSSPGLISISYDQLFEVIPISSVGILPRIDAFTIPTIETSGSAPFYSGGGGLEIIEYLPGGTKHLLGDVAIGATPVHVGEPPFPDPPDDPFYPPDDPPDPPGVPEPATIVLLGLAGLSLRKRRRP